MAAKMRECRLIIFAKAPISGRVKTRLIPSLGAKAAMCLHQKLIVHSLVKARQARVGPIDLWCAPSTAHPFFLCCQKKFRAGLHSQPRGDLGRRMAFALRTTLERASSALLIGTDAPSLTEGDLREAAKALARGMDAVVGPAEDGGYVLIGLRRFAPELFRGISWGTGCVLAETYERLHRLGWQWHELPKRWDVDRPEDVERLRTEGLLKGRHQGCENCF